MKEKIREEWCGASARQEVITRKRKDAILVITIKTKGKIGGAPSGAETNAGASKAGAPTKSPM